MKRKRERFDVIYDILVTIQKKKEIGPTRLLQLSNLSPQMFKDYMDELLGRQLIIENVVKKRKTYSVSDKGCLFLQEYRSFSNFVEQLGL
jgi:predicted transcriptional regulator